MKNIILTVNNGLKTKFNANQVKYKKTFLKAKKLDIDLNNTNIFIKTNFGFDNQPFFAKVSFIQYKSKITGKLTESITLLPYLKAIK
jgi:hypothetical protein